MDKFIIDPARNPDGRVRLRQSVLFSAIEKLAHAGEQAGFSIEEMIEMLRGGLTTSDLLDLIALRLTTSGATNRAQ